MEQKHFILLILISIYQFIVFKPVYSNNIADASINETDNNVTTSVGIDSSNITEDNTNETVSETLIENSTSTVASTTFETTTEATKDLLKLPEVFQARIRSSITSYPSSAYNVIVSYDLTKNRAAITKGDGQSKHRQIYDFARNRILNITGGQCSVEDISEDSIEDIKFPFPFYINNGVKVMKGPLSFFRLDGNDTEFQEEIYVSGVPCVEYNNTIDLGYVDKNNDSVRCKVRQFYSNPEWRNPNCVNTYCNPMPIRIDIECGVHPDLFYLQHTFSFLEFHEEIKDEEEFQQLPGVYCENAISEPFPMLSSSFQAELMQKYFLNNSLSKEKVWWDEPGNILRVDTIVGNKDIISIIMDYNRNLSFNITMLDTACDIVSHYEDKPSIFSFLVGSKSEDIWGIQKVGKRKCELSHCEVWTGKTALGETFDIYLYKRNSFTEDDYIPIFVDLFQNKMTSVRHARRKFNSYKSALGDWSVFDISPCFIDGSSTRFELTIDGDIGERWKNPSFRENIYNGIWNYSKIISPLRLQRLQIVPETNETITVKGIIIDDVSTISKVVSSYVDISSEDALKNIQTMIKREGVFHSKEGYQLKITDFRINEDTVDTGGKIYGPGDMGGLAVGMLLAGMICGAAVILLIIWTRMKRKETRGHNKDT